jgi:hypothetical protein
MENYTTLQIILKNSASTKNKNNKNLFKFLNLNYQEILQSNYYIQLILLTKDNYKLFTKKITNTPTLINTKDEHMETGTYNIINYLIKLCEGEEYNPENDTFINNNEMTSTPTHNTNKENNSNDLLHDFLLNEALKDDTIEEPLDLNRVKDKENLYKSKQGKQKEINTKFAHNMINVSKSNYSNKNISIDNLSNEEKNMLDNNELTKTGPISDFMSDDKDLQKFWQNMEETE